MTGQLKKNLSTLVAFRGLWDKFAPPSSVGAYRRALRKGVPFLFDPKLSGVTLDDLGDCMTASPGNVPLFVMVDDTETSVKSLLNRCQMHPIFFVVRTENTMFSVYSLESGQLVTCGLYLTVRALLANNYPMHELGEAKIVLFESIDTQLSLTVKKNCRALDDACVEQRLLSLISTQAKFYKVTDLVERELVMRVQGSNR
jgi:hypothetical protein